MFRLVSRNQAILDFVERKYVCNTVEPLITDTLINEHLQ
jgi:hypothetical protein